ncbi:MAG: SLC13 family permease, partial [Gammaproteobacteria bacterium]
MIILAAMELPGPHAILVLCLTVAAFVLFTIRRVPVELTSIAVLVALPVLFVFFPYEADGEALDPRGFFYGFGHEALIAICALMILGQGLVDTGALNPVTARLAKLWRRGPRTGLLVVLLACLAISGVLNDTPIVVLMIPVLVGLARETGASSARLLMPMNFAVLIGGMATTIGTSTNLLVVAIAADLGAARFGVFDFTPLVAIAALVALPYLWLLAPRLLPSRGGADQAPVERIYDAVLHVPPDSPLIGLTLADLRERSKQALRVHELRRGQNMSVVRLPMVKLAAGDRLLVSDTARKL